ncbi:MAG: hypothetical protein QNJ75_11865 [Acidimicrobiia bacterium]|nr:hypothetical protein [Acidimicrobiia bacterium]
MRTRRSTCLIVVLLSALAVLSSGCEACDCSQPGETYMPLADIDRLVPDPFPMDVEICVGDNPCRTYTDVPNHQQILTIKEIEASETTPPMPQFTITFVGESTTILTQDSFSIRTVEVSGCCAGWNHRIEPRD